MMATMRGLAVCLASLSMMLAASLPTMAGEDDDRAAVGLKLSEQLCARCHAVSNEVESPHKDAPPFRTFAAKWPLENLEESLAEGIVTGHPDMPAFVFEPKDIDALIEHLHSLALASPSRQ